MMWLTLERTRFLVKCNADRALPNTVHLQKENKAMRPSFDALDRARSGANAHVFSYHLVNRLISFA